MANKGFSYERKICKQLSLWWAHNKRDDIFWRTAGSGGRATTRSKQNINTFGQFGDIQATDPIGQPFIDVFLTEIKRGYPNATISNIIDAPPKTKANQLEEFIIKTTHSTKAAKTYSWMILHKRDRREPVIILPRQIDERLHLFTNCAHYNKLFCFVSFHTKQNIRHEITQLLWSDFLQLVKPEQIIEISKQC